jgi:hypothetical protein
MTKRAASITSRSKMPEPDLEIDASNVLVEWGHVRLTGPGTLRLTGQEVFLDARVGGTVRARYDDLRGGGWRTGTLTIHGEPGYVAIESSRGLEFEWVQLVERACPLPELARAHRRLGSRRGGSAEAQAKFLAPLLQARKRVEEAKDLESRVAALEARILRERIDTVLQAIAKDAHPASAPDRRGLEAELEEAMSAFFAGLAAVESAAKTFRGAPEAIRFLAWREWVLAVSSAFTLADTGWANASHLLPSSITP